MRILPSQQPTAKQEGEHIVGTIQSAGTRFEICLTPHEAKMFGVFLIQEAEARVAECRPEAEIIVFERRA